MESSKIETTSDQSVFDFLQSQNHIWVGNGVNHEQEPFDAILATRPLFKKAGVTLWFRASGASGKVYHEEVALIGKGPSDVLVMESISTNVPYLQHFSALPERSVPGAPNLNEIKFYHGDHSSNDGFRELVSLTLTDRKVLNFEFSWGMPGEEVISRSAVALSQSSLELPSDSPLR